MKNEFDILRFGNDVKIFSKKVVSDDKKDILEFCYDYINNNLEDSPFDAFTIYHSDHQVSDKLINIGLSFCKEVAIFENKYKKNCEGEFWINRVKKQNPIQKSYKTNDNKILFHSHKEINEINKRFIPTYTFVYYIQMPNNLKNKDGVLYLKDKNEQIYDFLPEESTIIVMDGDLYHSPNSALNSTLDRIVFAGNVFFYEDKLNKTII